jgi:hypothetical protein
MTEKCDNRNAMNLVFKHSDIQCHIVNSSMDQSTVASEPVI